MKKKQFIKVLRNLGLGLPSDSFSNNRRKFKDKAFSGTVLIVGAGAAGMYAGYLLKQKGVSFKIIEASSQIGGRMKTNHSFTDFPIALGAEWIAKLNPKFGDIIEAKEAFKKLPKASYAADDTYGTWRKGKLTIDILGFFNYKKFINNSWLGFFQEFIAPTIRENIVFDTPIRLIDYSGQQVSVQSDKKQYTADRLIFTAPVSLIQDESIRFAPALPQKKQEAIQNTVVWDGFKAFFAFEKKFYPSFVDYTIYPKKSGQVSLYDAAHGQKSNKNILGLFSVGLPAKKYASLNEADFKREILVELDHIFDGQATKYYINHITQNWSNEPFAKGAYVNDYASQKFNTQLQKSVAHKIYFAGDSYIAGSDWGNVHNAIESAVQSIKEVLSK